MTNQQVEYTTNIFDKNKPLGDENPINENGMFTLKFEIEEEYVKYLNISWYYMPTKENISPMRYKWAKDPKPENAIYGYHNEELN